MLKVLLNILKMPAEKVIVKEQVGFRAGRSTTKQIFNLRILCEISTAQARSVSPLHRLQKSF